MGPAMATGDGVRELDHTADIGFEAEAAAPERLFELAARGLVSALGAAADPDVPPARDRLELERGDLERLLVAWLRELLHRAVTEGALPEVEELGLDAGEESLDAGEEGGPVALSARIAWRPWAEGPVREIKGVTYHGLRVGRRGDGWHARVVLDV